MKLTQKEYDFLNQIVKSDYSTDGQGFVDYITDFDYTMKTVRGLIPSLVEKGVISYDEESGIEDSRGRDMAVAYINEQYSDIKNHKLINIEVA